MLIASSVSPKASIFEVCYEHKNGTVFTLHILYAYDIDSKLLQEKLHVPSVFWYPPRARQVLSGSL